ncbi:MAG: pyrroline-5-carboxylate reductase [Fusobacteriaceae bacterium]
MNLLFIGIGNMGGAILKSILKFSGENKYNIFVAKNSDKTFDNMKTFGKFSLYMKENLKDIEIIFLGVKPYQVEDAINQHIEKISDSQIIVSMAAGVTIEKLETFFGKSKKIIRIMPNMSMVVGEGMTSITPNKNITKTDLEKIKNILEKNSKCSVIKEENIHAFIGMAGSSPAFAFLFLEAMADAGEKFGLSRQEALSFATQSFLGSAKLLQESKIDTTTLINSICSPNGTTIQGVKSLQENNFKKIVVEAVTKTIERSIEMSKK